MRVSWSRGCSAYFRFGELIGVDIKDVSVIEIGIALGLTSKVMPPENDDTGP
jgi:hypothetical protein